MIQQAVDLYESGDTKAAFGLTLKILEERTDDADALILQSLLLEKFDRFVDAAYQMYGAILCRPKYEDKHNVFGFDYPRMARYLQRTLLKMDEAADQHELNPDEMEHQTKLMMALALQMQGRDQEALAWYEKCLLWDITHHFALYYQSLITNDGLIDLEGEILAVDFKDRLDAHEIDTLNEALYAETKGHPTFRREVQREAPYQKWITGDLCESPVKPFKRMHEMIRREVDSLRARLTARTGHPFYGTIPEKYHIHLFGALLGPGGFHSPHVHSRAWLSGGYYARVPEIDGSDDEEHAGCIEFGRCFLGEPETFRGPKRFIEPEEGLMWMWPSYYIHNTVPCKSERERLTMGFNIFPVN